MSLSLGLLGEIHVLNIEEKCFCTYLVNNTSYSRHGMAIKNHSLNKCKFRAWT